MTTPVITGDDKHRPVVVGPSGRTFILALDAQPSDLIAAVDYYLDWLRHQPENDDTRGDIDALLDARLELTVEDVA